MFFLLFINTDNIATRYPWLCLKGQSALEDSFLDFLTVIHHILQKTLSATHVFIMNILSHLEWTQFGKYWVYLNSFYQGRHTDLFALEAAWWN